VEEHPFTISSSPAGEELCISVKGSGDFTSGVGKTEVGDKASVLAPYGRFSYLLNSERKKLVFIAGGIGITPFLSMIRYMRDSDSKKETVLFYCSRTQWGIAHREELDAIAGGKVKVIHVLSKPETAWQGEKGRISAEIIQRYVSGLENTGFYICGPPPMMDSARQVLLSIGVDASEIHTERFSL
jgi:predicted ferric reductase